MTYNVFSGTLNPTQSAIVELHGLRVVLLEDGTETVQVTPLKRTLAASPYSECASCHQQGRVGSRTLLQQNSQFLTQVERRQQQLCSSFRSVDEYNTSGACWFVRH